MYPSLRKRYNKLLQNYTIENKNYFTFNIWLSPHLLAFVLTFDSYYLWDLQNLIPRLGCCTKPSYQGSPEEAEGRNGHALELAAETEGLGNWFGLREVVASFSVLFSLSALFSSS